MLALVFCPDAAADSARSGLRLCAEMLVPSLLPFFVVSGLLRAWGLPGVLARLLEPATARLWGVDAACVSAFLLGILGGYPLGAAMIGRLRADGAHQFFIPDRDRTSVDQRFHALPADLFDVGNFSMQYIRHLGACNGSGRFSGCHSALIGLADAAGDRV